jgi:hypothetical protein
VIDEQKGRRSAYIGIWIVAILLPLYFAFFYAGRPDTGKYVCIGVGMHLIAIWINWDLRRQLWFWTTIATLLAIHIPLLLIVPWPSRWIPAMSVLPFGVADCALILGVIALMERLMKRRAHAMPE